MKLSPTELAKVNQLLEKIDEGKAEPQFHGHIGRFLRQYAARRMLVEGALAQLRIPQRADGAISGEHLGAIKVFPMLAPEVSLLHFPLGEVAETIVLSEELGGFLNMTMWLKGAIANSAFTRLREGEALQLTGDFRWFPNVRLTPGEAKLDSCYEDVAWATARCLKAVADDISRPPHAAEYILDYRLGAPGIKFFRSVCVVKAGSGLQILPALGSSKRLACRTLLAEASAVLKTSDLAILLIYREPWAEEWTAVRAVGIGPDDVLTHSITWADFQRELDGSSVDGPLVTAIASAIRAAGVRPGTTGNPNLARSLLSSARTVIGLTHRSS